MKRELLRTQAFIRALRRFLKKHAHSTSEVEIAIELLAADAFDPRLKAHKLKGDFDGVWACSAGYDLRILFEYVQYKGTEAILLLTIGTHDEVY